MKRHWYFFIISFVLVIASLILSYSSMALALILAIMGILLMGFNVFERKEVSAEKIVLLAILTAVSAAGRVLFSSLPSVNPSSFIIIMSAMIFGPSFGFMTGALTALVSNMLLGHGPWTLWQMLFWGLMGFLAGVLKKPLKEHMWFRLAYGFVWGFLFGWGMNVFYVLSGYIAEPGIKTFLVACSASFVLDLLHAGTNLLLILLLGNGFIKIFERAAAKYGLKDVPIKRE
ncbi:MAG TPA: ECF transporter S component [Clostridia bacterium]|nr:MAG: hypothetical protein BWX78_01480 [Firmicutes bacterium ADurb.Bin099]HNZ41120.1 ECF transporter S component [Clostridia bacterium]HPY98451.1 ECF transporter S component [Clostridia bacterium]HQC68329.1 ECF transporter S component [Clostridia bacterium]